MRAICWLGIILVVSGTGRSEDLVRIEYDEKTAPAGLLFKVMVENYRGADDDLGYQAIYSELNSVQLPNGSWTLPREPQHSVYEVIDLTEYLRAVSEKADERLDEMWRVLACRSVGDRPSGDDVYLVVEVIEDAEDGYWEQLRQRAIRERPVLEGLISKHRQKMSMRVIRHNQRVLMERDPDLWLDQLCRNRGLASTADSG